MTPSATDTIHLAAGRATATVDPFRGGALTSLVVDGQELLLPPRPGQAFSEPAAPFPMSGSFLMAPWVGHVADGRLTFRGAVHQLPLTWNGHAVHGLVATGAWAVEASSDTEVIMTRELDPPWPFGGMVRQDIRLEPTAIDLRASITAADAPMPAALGWHPWFLRPPSAPVRVRVIADALLEHDADELPTGRLIDIAGETYLANGPVLGDRRIDVVYVKAATPADLWLGDRWLRIAFDPRIDTVVVYTPPNTVCVEPWSSWPDASRLHAAGHDTGVVELEPGESLERWTRWNWGSPTAAPGTRGS